MWTSIRDCLKSLFMFGSGSFKKFKYINLIRDLRVKINCDQENY